MTSDGTNSLAENRSRRLLASLRTEALAPPPSGIVELFNMGRTRPNVIPLWVGEGDLPSPPLVLRAMRQSLDAGETFYAAQRGVPAFRAAIAAYMGRHYGVNKDFARGVDGGYAVERFSVTIGGMHALQIALRMVAGPGAEVIVPTPAWPNFAGALLAVGAEPVETPLDFVEADGEYAWSLDLDRLRDAVGPRTRAMIINSPGNPTGWTASPGELKAILEIARRHGLWIIADEIYGRIVFSGPRAPSFHDVMELDDRVMFVQTMSKNWAMTGLRVGWLEAPEAFGPVIENLIQYSSSGVAVPVQRAATAALEHGEAFFAGQMARMRESRDILCGGLASTGRVRFAAPNASFYLFCAMPDFPDSREMAIRLLDEAGVGVAPGSAFGAAGAPFARLCFARAPDQIKKATIRLMQWLAR